MGIVNNALSGASGQSSGYNLTNSLRFRSSAGAYLNRTPASAGNQKTWTYSTWIKRGAVSAEGTLISGGATTGRLCVFFNSSGNLVSDVGGTGTFDQSVAVYRDPSAWYHFVWQFDTTQATAANRSRMYINGSQISLTQTRTFALNTDYQINNSVLQTLGTFSNSIGTYNFDGYQAETNFIDGQALTPSSFGQTSATTGVWIPKKFSGTYGTNGFYLPFTDNSALTTSSNAGLGKDFSGNSNYWTTNNISITSGSTYDSMTDVPTLTSATAANYCVLSPVDTYDNPPTQGNLARIGVGHTGSPFSTCRGTIGVSSGKWYFEALNTGTTGSSGNNMIGVMTTTTSALDNTYGGSTTSSYQDNGGLQGDNSTGTVSSSGNGDIIMVAFDVDTSKMWVGKNGTWMNSGNPVTGVGYVFSALPVSPLAPQVSMYGNSGDTKGWILNFGQRPFAYTAPTGFKALNTFNLPTPTIGATASTTANKYFDATTYTGTGANQSITNSGSMQPDLVWAKNRSTTDFHILQDSIRGTGKELFSNATNAEETYSNSLTSFNANGFTLGDRTPINRSSSPYIAWQWRASNATAVTNTNGTITSTVSANTSAGFSIVTYTGTGSNATVGHGLGVAPSMIIVKRRDAGGSGWSVYFTTLPAGYVLSLQSTAAQANSSGRFTTTLPTSSVFSIGTDSDLNASAGTYVAYCFAPVSGNSAFGSYTGNGSSDGTFVHLGFRPKFVMIKSSTVGENWNIEDSSRSAYNQTAQVLYANNSRAEEPYYPIDMLSNGFKVRSSESGTNESGATYIYMAFAESPFKYANAR